MIEFELIDKNGKRKEKVMEFNYLINASMRDKIVYNCIVTGERVYRSIDSIVKLENHSLKKIDLSDITIFMNKEFSRKKRMVRKYGVENNFQRLDVKEKIKQTNLEKYGFCSFTQTEEYNLKSKKTKLEKYGNPRFNNREKAKKTNLEKYGFEHQSKNKGILKKIKLGVSRKGLISSIGILKENNVEFLNTDDYIGQRTEEKDVIYNFRCLKCGEIFKDTIHSKIPKCPKCYPKYRSKPEIEIEKYINFLGFETKNSLRNLITPYEIDIYIPEANFAIELNGLYWHSEIQGKKDKFYHQNKTLLAKKKGINLIHIFEDEWNSEENKIKKILKNKLLFKENKYSEIMNLRIYPEFFNFGDEVLEPSFFWLDKNYSKRKTNKGIDKIWDCGYYIRKEI